MSRSGASPCVGLTTARSGAIVTPCSGSEAFSRSGKEVTLRTNLVVHLQGALQDLVDPRRVDRGQIEVVRVDCVTPLVVGAAEPLRAAGGQGFQPLGKHLPQHGHREERPRHLDEVQPIVVRRSSMPLLRRGSSGTSRTTATGNV